MVLSDKDIKLALASGKLIIEPLDDPDRQIQPASVDLRLSDEFCRYGTDHAVMIDTRESDVEAMTESFCLPEGEALILHPGEFVLGSTIEWIKMPDDMAGTLTGRSSMGRLGLATNFAGFIDPGSYCNLTVQLKNLGSLPIALWPGMRICQISLHLLSSPTERPYGAEGRDSKYQGSVGPVASKIAADEDERPSALLSVGNQGEPDGAPQRGAPATSIATPEPWPAGHATKGIGTPTDRG